MSRRMLLGFILAVLIQTETPGGRANGSCIAGPWVRFNHSYRITPDDAERICQREARARFSPGNGEIWGIFLRNISTRKAYRVEWRYAPAGRIVRKGWCEIDSWSGGLRKFHANEGW